MPVSVRIGDDCVAWLTFRNHDSSVITLDHFTIDSRFEANLSDGIAVASSEPPYEQRKSVAKEEEIKFGTLINPDDVFRVQLMLRAKQAGEFKGYIFSDLLLPGRATMRHTRPVLVRMRVDAE